MSRSSEPVGPDTAPAKPSAQVRAARDTGRSSREGSERRLPLTLTSFALLLFAVGSAAVGQVMLKHGMQIATSRSAHSGSSLLVSAATSAWVLLGLVVFAISAFAWLATLARVPLSVAYPFNALGYLGILIASVLILHERASVGTWVGSLLVVCGLIIVVSTQS